MANAPPERVDAICEAQTGHVQLAGQPPTVATAHGLANEWEHVQKTCQPEVLQHLGGLIRRTIDHLRSAGPRGAPQRAEFVKWARDKRAAGHSREEILGEARRRWPNVKPDQLARWLREHLGVRKQKERKKTT